MGKRGAAKKDVPTIEKVREMVGALVTADELQAADVTAGAKKHFPACPAHQDRFKAAGGALLEAYTALRAQVGYNQSHKSKEVKLEERKLGYALLAKTPEHPVLDRAQEIGQVAGRE